MKCKSNDAKSWDDGAGKPSSHGSKYTVFPELRTPEEFGRSYNTDRLGEPLGWLAKLRYLIVKRGNNGDLK